MNKPFKEIEFTPEDIYKELMKSGIKFKLNEEYKYLENSLTEDEKKFVRTMESMGYKYNKEGKTSGDYIKDYVDKIKRRKTMNKIHFLKSEVTIDDEIFVKLKDTKGNVVLEGDYYHDKIEEKIDGFVDGLTYVGYEVDIIEIG